MARRAVIPSPARQMEVSRAYVDIYKSALLPRTCTTEIA